MRKEHCLIAVALLLGSAATFPAGCIDYRAEYYTPLTNPNLLDGGLPAGCDPSQSTQPVADSCGVFVSPTGDDGNAGTKEKPLKTLTKALGKGSAIYACAGPNAFEEAVTLHNKAALFGGLDCASWAYDATTKTQLTAASDQVPLTLTSSASGSEVHDFTITAADAAAAGGSSIAVLDDGANLDLTRCDLAAGKGADGAPGQAPTGSGQVGANAPAPTPTNALDGCMSTSPNGVFGGAPGVMMCGSVATSGGKGGDGTNLMIGGIGTDAQPQPQPNAMPGSDGKGGKQQDTMACKGGDDGAAGLAGAMPGTGATGLGDLTPTGYQAPTATPGQSAGTPGYGGGGGGGANKCLNGFAGPAGGGGGAGGCGGQPGSAGNSAGSSFALVSLNATISLNTVTITTANGGTGGAGGDGQLGGHGGNGGMAGSSGSDPASACNGGKGGQGGRGSSGGGGLGGHSIGIAFKGNAPVQTGVTIHHGNGGPGGIGGNMDNTSPGIVGGNGLACTTLDFAKPTSCMP